jgi:ABC-type branched-subunit amino acid transport system substrate-binding protein
MRRLKQFLALFVIVVTPFFFLRADDPNPVKIGVPTVLSGDFANLGQNIVWTVETYKKHMLRHPLVFEFEDARISSQDGLQAYQTLINLKHVDVLIGATSSNGTVAGSALINSSHTVMLSPVTGGTSVDNAGEYIFRIGNSDLLSGVQEAELLLSKKLLNIALLTEQTEHTEDVIGAFKHKFSGKLLYDDTFAPGTTDFKTQISLILRAKPQAIFMATQTGIPLALFLQQLKQLGGFKGEIHTTFDAAINADAKKMAGDLLKGIYYMAPVLEENNPLLQNFVQLYKSDHNQTPSILFHTAGTVDALNMLQDYLDHAKSFSKEDFKNYLLAHIRNYKGLMGNYSFDDQGNSDMGFRPARIE